MLANDTGPLNQTREKYRGELFRCLSTRPVWTMDQCGDLCKVLA